ncbi:thioesterase family protein [Flavobacterium sp. HSC-61S13]|uniref:acyl-CoA thioesterase n=1 Tax=Flavobacterium sp. HSC-61S13 TaxID=2910963 RepID=UPI00209F267A|nr:acyl-CoA thioester hydrolase [Flavobacterium sp. HSC-61S13]
MSTENQLTNFNFFQPLEIRWNDMDALGHVNNVFYMEYFQIGRGYYMNAVSPSWDWMKNMFVIAHIECDFQKELRLDAKNPQIGLRISRLGNKSFDIAYIVVSKGRDGETIVHATGSSTQVIIDIESHQSISVPNWLRDDIFRLETGLGS